MKTRTSYQQPPPGCYRLAPGIHIRAETVICDYPLRAMRPGAATLKLLGLCTREQTCAELAVQINLPVKRVQTLCEQLYWKGLLDAGPRIPPETWPGVSIIIPSRNRARQLERSLYSLTNLDYPLNRLEIMVVDDASTDETSVMLSRLAPEFEAHGLILRVLRHTRQQGVAISRNSGAEQANMEIVAFIDSDCVATPGWLAALTPILQDNSIGAVGGMIRAHERRTAFGRYEDVRSSLHMGARPQQVRLDGPLTYLPTANFLVRHSEWQKLGGFAPLTYGEDVDFCRRLLSSGSAIRYEPRGIVLHDYRTDIPGFLKTRVSYASSEAVLLQRHATERRVLTLPPEQAAFAVLAIGGLWGAVWRALKARGRPQGSPPLIPTATALTLIRKEAPQSRSHCKGVGRVGVAGDPCGRPRAYTAVTSISCIILAALLALFGAGKRLAAVRRQRISLNPLVILRATVRGHLAYVYHLCRHLTRYYMLPMLIAGIIFPPLLLLAFILHSIVNSVDYTRLHPNLSFGKFAFCSLLDDCAYEIGVVLGCIKRRTWKPLVPIIKRK